MAGEEDLGLDATTILMVDLTALYAITLTLLLARNEEDAYVIGSAS